MQTHHEPSVRRRLTLDVLIRIRWLPVVVVALVAAAVIWVLLNPAAFPQCLILCAAAVPLAIIGRDLPE